MHAPQRKFSAPSSVIHECSLVHVSAPADPIQPRRRPSPAQLQALQRMFRLKSHPTHGERVALAVEIGMELKNVTIWFQNKRSSTKKQALIYAVNNAAPRPPKRTQSSTTIDSTMSSGSLRQAVSLDYVAQLSELPTGPLARDISNSAPLPVTPRRTPASAEIWERMLSSPVTGPPSPGDKARLAIIPNHSKSKKSLEWACAKARVVKGHGGNEENRPIQRKATVPRWGMQDQEGIDEETDTDTDIDDILTPDSSADWGLAVGCDAAERKAVTALQSEDMEAAMVLLDFKGRH